MFVFENVYGAVSQEVKSEINNLWQLERPFVTGQVLESRLKHVVFCVRDADTGMMVGVSSAENKKVPGLNDHFLYDFDWLIIRSQRSIKEEVKLAKMTIDFLESITGQADHKSIGVFSILEDEILKNDRNWSKAAWPELGLYLMGFTKSGNPIRVHYFNDVRI